MLRRLCNVLSLALVLCAGGLSSPASVSAYGNLSDPDGNAYTTNLAGRPINGYSYDGALGCHCRPLSWQGSIAGYRDDFGTCHGVAYAGIVQSGVTTIVLLTAGHCRDGDADTTFDGKSVYGPNSSKIGYWSDQGATQIGGPQFCHAGDCATDHDLAVIFLYSGNWPSSLNQIYRGNVTGNDYWTITDDTGIVPKCTTGLQGEIGRTIYQNMQFTYLSSEPFRTGTITTVDALNDSDPGTCAVGTSLDLHTGYRDSGTPLIMCCVGTGYVNTVFGIGSYAVGTKLYFTPLYNGFLDVYHSMQDLGGTAHICKTASCT